MGQADGAAKPRLTSGGKAEPVCKAKRRSLRSRNNSTSLNSPKEYLDASPKLSSVYNANACELAPLAAMVMEHSHAASAQTSVYGIDPATCVPPACL